MLPQQCSVEVESLPDLPFQMLESAFCGCPADRFVVSVGPSGAHS